MLKAFMKSKKGFTLVELMVVVVIIGILTAIAIPVYNATSTRAEEGACQANQRMIDGAIQQYFANTGEYPENISKMVGSYFESEPKCPKGGSYNLTSDKKHVAKPTTGCTHKYYGNAEGTWPD